MAGTLMVPVGVSGYSLTARLYPLTSDTLSDSYTLTEYATRRGLYSAAVSGALSGDFYCNCVTASGDIIFTGFTSLSLTSGNFLVSDYGWNPHFGLSTSDPLNVNVVQWSGVNVIPATIQGMPSVNVEYVGGILQQITDYLDSYISQVPSGTLFYNIPEPTGVFTWEANLSKIAAWLGALARNKVTQTESVQTLLSDANVDIATSNTSDDGTTFTREEWL